MRRQTKNALIAEATSADVTSTIARLVAHLLRAQHISARQFEKALRYAVVHLEASSYAPTKANKAQIAFATGLSRSDVARLLRHPRPVVQSDIESLVALWISDPRFVGAAGNPADLPVFGRTKSFEQLAAMRGKGIPVRAILDELLDLGIVALLTGQRVRLQQPVPRLDRQVWARTINRIEAAISEAVKRDTPTSAGGRGQRSRRTHLRRRPAVPPQMNK